MQPGHCTVGKWRILGVNHPTHVGWVWLMSLLSLFPCSIGGSWCCLSLKRGRMCHCISRWNAGKDGRTQHSNPVEAKTRERNWCPESWEGRHCHPIVFFRSGRTIQKPALSCGWTRGSRSIILILLILLLLLIIIIISSLSWSSSSSSSTSSSASAQLSSSSHFAVIGRSKRWSNHPRHGRKEGSRERAFHALSQCAGFWI